MKDIPDILYKYRDWGNSSHKRLLTHNEIYWASPKQFNDPFDARIPFRYDDKDLTPENIFLKYLEIGKRIEPTYDSQQLHELAFDYQSRNLLFDEDHIAEQNKMMQKEFDSNYGIISLSANRNNFLMWSHYSNSHHGFCVGFNSKKIFDQSQGKIGPVIYSDVFPKFGLFEDLTHHSIKATYYKSDIWKYENEYRLLRAKVSKRVQALTSDTIEEIVLGYKMDQKEKFNIIKIAEKRFPDARVYDVQLHSSKFELVLNAIR